MRMTTSGGFGNGREVDRVDRQCRGKGCRPVGITAQRCSRADKGGTVSGQLDQEGFGLGRTTGSRDQQERCELGRAEDTLCR